MQVLSLTASPFPHFPTPPPHPTQDEGDAGRMQHQVPPRAQPEQVGGFWGGSLSASPALETLPFGHLRGSSDLAFSQPLGRTGGFVHLAARPKASKRRVEAYVAEMTKELEEAVKKELDKDRETWPPPRPHL
ncbi:hypothetical protein JRQ81_009935 [Phrynocephalus forsythii]|uniref:Uncharacterized protein n=1 Tax=Phrynocephalus forsythii TaxID=171643 RepID=A0A9Q0XB10_9SAUR|nr:hypothetical protein JRQ81_009935 [Phrynocephalus forsythii]